MTLYLLEWKNIEDETRSSVLMPADSAGAAVEALTGEIVYEPEFEGLLVTPYRSCPILDEEQTAILKKLLEQYFKWEM